MKVKTTLILAFTIIFCFSLSNSILANPISEVRRATAKEDLKNDLKERYGSSYSTIETLLNQGMEAYDELCSIPDTRVNNKILRDLKSRYYPSFSTILTLYRQNKESYENLN